jgi:hypothetical protein
VLPTLPHASLPSSIPIDFVAECVCCRQLLNANAAAREKMAWNRMTNSFSPDDMTAVKIQILLLLGILGSLDCTFLVKLCVFPKSRIIKMVLTLS